MTNPAVRPACRLEWLGRARMALGRPAADRDAVDVEALAMWPDPPLSSTRLEDIDRDLWPEHLEHRAREIAEAERKRKERAREKKGE